MPYTRVDLLSPREQREPYDLKKFGAWENITNAWENIINAIKNPVTWILFIIAIIIGIVAGYYVTNFFSASRLGGSLLGFLKK